MSCLVSTTRSALLRRIDARLSRALAARTEAEDILQQAFVSAIPHFRRQPVRDPHGFVRWMLQFATNEIRNTSRRRGVDEVFLEWESAPARFRESTVGTTLRVTLGAEPQERVLALRDRFSLRWTTVSFLLRRPDASSTRKLLGRARRRLSGTLSELQRLSMRPGPFAPQPLGPGRLAPEPVLSRRRSRPGRR